MITAVFLQTNKKKHTFFVSSSKIFLWFIIQSFRVFNFLIFVWIHVRFKFPVLTTNFMCRLLFSHFGKIFQQSHSKHKRFLSTELFIPSHRAALRGASRVDTDNVHTETFSTFLILCWAELERILKISNSKQSKVTSASSVLCTANIYFYLS